MKLAAYKDLYVTTEEKLVSAKKLFATQFLYLQPKQETKKGWNWPLPIPSVLNKNSQLNPREDNLIKHHPNRISTSSYL